MAAKAKTNPNKDTNMGRPTLYREEYVEQYRRLCLLGCIDTEAVKFFGVSIATLMEWKNVYPDFSEAEKHGKMVADSNVANALYDRALGFTTQNTKFRVNKNTQELEEYTETTQHPPDTGAAMAWLKNRRGKQWRDRVEQAHVDADGNDLPPPVLLIQPVSPVAQPATKDEDNV